MPRPCSLRLPVLEEFLKPLTDPDREGTEKNLVESGFTPQISDLEMTCMLVIDKIMGQLIQEKQIFHDLRVFLPCCGHPNLVQVFALKSMSSSTIWFGTDWLDFSAFQAWQTLELSSSFVFVSDADTRFIFGLSAKTFGEVGWTPGLLSFTF